MQGTNGRLALQVANLLGRLLLITPNDLRRFITFKLDIYRNCLSHIFLLGSCTHNLPLIYLRLMLLQNHQASFVSSIRIATNVPSQLRFHSPAFLSLRSLCRPTSGRLDLISTMCAVDLSELTTSRHAMWAPGAAGWVSYHPLVLGVYKGYAARCSASRLTERLETVYLIPLWKRRWVHDDACLRTRAWTRSISRLELWNNRSTVAPPRIACEQLSHHAPTS